MRLRNIGIDAGERGIVDRTLVKDKPTSIVQEMSNSIARPWITAARARTETTILSFHLEVLAHL